MELNIKGKFFYSLSSCYGFELGGKYKVLDVLDIEKYNASYVKDFCRVVVDVKGDGEERSVFFATMFNIHFTDDYKKVIESIRVSILSEARELDRLKPIKERTDLKINEVETKINKLRNLSRELHLNNKK